MTFTLRPYQKEAIEKTREKLQYARSALIALFVGAGKSIIISTLAKDFKRVVVLQPCLELVKQNHAKLADAGLNTTMISSAHKGDWSADYIYTTPQTLSKNLDKCQEPDCLVIDECFTGDTLVATPDGYKKIKDIKVGDKVYNATGIGIVLATTKKYTNKTKTMELSNGQEITGTYSHPIFTKQGWTRLEHVGIREPLFGIQDMPFLWENVSTAARLFDKRTAICHENLLQSLLREYNAPTQQDSRTVQGKIAEWWKREIDSVAGALFTSDVEGRLAVRVRGKDRTLSRWQRLSTLLQVRLGRPCAENRNRSGRRVSQWQGAQSTRRKEDGFFGTVRVESVSHNEQASDVAVYNLHVSGHPSYFAGGVLVHNCNVFYNGKLFDAIFNKWKRCKVVALTATPYHYKQKTIVRGGWIVSQSTIVSIEEQFGKAVVSVDRHDGRAMGFGPDIKIKKAPIPMCKDEHVKNPRVYHALICEHLKALFALLDNCKNGIIYCDSKPHAELISRQANIPTIFGDTPKKERMEIVEKFNAGKIPFIATVGCLVRGYDRQDLENIIILTNFNNECEAEQVIGRLNRGTCSKTCWYNGRLNQNKPVAGKTTEVRIRRL